jgi:Conjugative transposon protein TcpC
MRVPTAAPGGGGVDGLPEDLLATPAPAPSNGAASAVLRVLARVVLWTLVAVGALRGLLPLGPEAGRPAVVTAAPAGQASAVAAAFLREYLTVAGDAAGRAERLGRFTAAGVELDGSVSLPAGVTQYADQVVASEVRPVDGGVEVTVLAHVLQLRSGGYRDGGTLAFVVPLVTGAGGLAVRGVPRPTGPPVAAGRLVGRPQAVSATLAPVVARAARQAVAAMARRDVAALVRLGGGVSPEVRPLPVGWRAVGVGAAEVAGPVAALSARVALRARAPAGAVYLVPVLVRLEAGPRGVLVRRVDAGGTA